MPDYTTDPTEADLKTWLLGTGLVEDFAQGPAAALDYAGAMATAVNEWKLATGYRAGFVAGSSDTSLEYYPREIRNRVLYLQTGLVSLTSLLIGESAATEGRDFILGPSGAGVMGQPFKRVEFLGYLPCGADVIRVTGKIGYATEYPVNVWKAIVTRAAEKLSPQLGLQISGGIGGLRADDVALRFNGAGSLINDSQTWRTLVRQYKF